MRRSSFHFATMALALLPLLAGAQGRLVYSPASVEDQISRTLWFSSENAAGLAFKPLADFHVVDFSYGYDRGDWHRVQSGEQTGTFLFDTQGAQAVGKTRLWGHFSYGNVTDRGAAFNTVLYDPYDERMMFSVADPVSSDWKRQAYDMEFKVAVPFSDAWAGGLHLRYTDRIGAKQMDPRSETYKYSLDVRPSLLLRSGRSSFGLSLHYSNVFERSVPTLSNVSQHQDAYVLRGLGNYVLEMVGSGGLSTLFHRCHVGGLALQYGHDGAVELLSELKADYHMTKSTESATSPYILGSTGMLDLSGRFQLLSEAWMLSADGGWRMTDATEYVSLWNISEGIWEVKSTAVTGKYATSRASLAYDRFIGRSADTPYLWKLGGRVDWTDKNDCYLLPESSFTYDNLTLGLTADRLFPMDGAELDLSLSLTGNLNLSGSYVYSGIHPDDPPAAVWYPLDAEILTSHYGQVGLDAAFSKALSGKRLGGTSLVVRAGASCLMATAGRKRLACDLSLGLLF